MNHGITRRRVVVTGTATGIANLSSTPLMAATNKTLEVPPEDARHELTFMQWPVSRQAYRNRQFLSLVQKTITSIANAIAAFEPVVMLAGKETHRAARRKLSNKVKLWDVATEDLWCRDSGPLIALNNRGKRVVSHIKFNGWGKKQVHQKDAQIAKKLADRLGFELIASDVTGEAGGVDHDGHSLLIGHESSWLNPNRNPGLSRDEIERRLLRAYGARRMIWSPGLKGEDITDYHIDSLARFTGPGRIIINMPSRFDTADPFHRAAAETRRALIAAGLNVHTIPEPDNRRVKTRDFVASYVNYYVCNGAVIASQFGDRTTDKMAVSAFKKHYPGREVVTLNVDALGEIGGGIHCATQQLPSA